MKKRYIVGNWKSNKTNLEATEWLERYTNKDLRFTNKEVVLCPSFTLLPNLKSYILHHKSFIKLGAQDVSPFEDGPYTGEVSARQIKELCSYVIIGHSERRKHFGETEQMIGKKIEQAVKYKLTPIVCISNVAQVQNEKLKVKKSALREYSAKFKILVAYEPLFAIGSGNPDTPENADSIAFTLKKELGSVPVLYGGSVTGTNVKSFTGKSNIDGILVGGASLDPKEFVNIIHNA